MKFTETYKNQINIISLIFLGMVLILFVTKSIYFPLSDFANYYFGSKFFLDGKSLFDIYEGYRFNQMIFAEGHKHVFVNYTPLPPITLLFFIPFTLFEVEIAKLVFNLFSASILFITLFYVFKYYSINLKYLFFIPVLFFFPILNNFLFGQVYILLFTLLIIGFLLFEKNHKKGAALLWSIAILLKIFPAIIIIYLVLKKEWKQIFYLISFCILLLIISVSIVGYSIWSQYIFSILPRLLHGEFHDTFTPHFQTMFVLLKNLFIHDSISNPAPVFESPVLFNILFLFFKALMLSIATFSSLKSTKSGIVKFSVWIVMSLMIAPYGSTYGLLLLIIFYVAFLKDFQADRTKIFLISITLFFICAVPIQKFLPFPFFLKYPRLYFMLFLIVMIFFIFKVKLKLNYLIPFLLIFTFSLKFDSSKSNYYLPAVKELMIYDYTVLNNRLNYRYWNDNGEKIKTIATSDSIWFDESLILKHNQIYYNGNQITDSNDRKLKPMRIGDDSIVFLSDANRGVGFYTFRTIDLPVQKINK